MQDKFVQPFSMMFSIATHRDTVKTIERLVAGPIGTAMQCRAVRVPWKDFMVDGIRPLEMITDPAYSITNSMSLMKGPLRDATTPKL